MNSGCKSLMCTIKPSAVSKLSMQRGHKNFSDIISPYSKRETKTGQKPVFLDYQLLLLI
jgi:hypothetical protein